MTKPIIEAIKRVLEIFDIVIDLFFNPRTVRTKIQIKTKGERKKPMPGPARLIP